ncbi:MAG: hypothetical protein KDA81_00015 [Planctomycetaceae bacterium]|nr:hypothetical protein [Planctomycetaceae bacterium]
MDLHAALVVHHATAADHLAALAAAVDLHAALVVHHAAAADLQVAALAVSLVADAVLVDVQCQQKLRLLQQLKHQLQLTHQLLQLKTHQRLRLRMHQLLQLKRLQRLNHFSNLTMLIESNRRQGCRLFSCAMAMLSPLPPFVLFAGHR